MNDTDRPYTFTPPEDRLKCDRMWTTDIEIIGMTQEELANGEALLALALAKISGGNIPPELYMERINDVIKKNAKLRARLTYHQEKCRYYEAYMHANKRRGFLDDGDDA